MITGASRASLAAVRRRLDEVTSQAGGVRQRLGGLFGGQSIAERRSVLADELYQVAALLVAQPQLRRAAADPASAPSARSGLLSQLLAGKISDDALDLVTTAVEQRWASPWDLGDALEQVADDSLLAAADADGTLSEVEDELFRLERILGAEPELTTLLDQADVPGERRAELLAGLLRGKASPVTQSLVEHAVASRRKRSIEHAVEALLAAAAARQDRSIARVISAVALSDEQERRLAATLTRIYGRPITVRTSVEPVVEGGLVVRVGDEVIDGSVAARLAQVRRAVAN